MASPKPAAAPVTIAVLPDQRSIDSTMLKSIELPKDFVFLLVRYLRT